MQIKELYEKFRSNPKVVTDSRNPEPNSIFFALKGANSDGNRYAQSALDAGCSFSVIDNAEYNTDERCILVDDVLDTLQKLARHHRRVLDLPILAITGTNGKTTTKELVSTVLRQKYRLGFTQGNFNNHIGVPLTLLSFSEETEMGVVEMGANHIGEIAALCEIAEPNYGLITNVGHAHLEGFGSFEGVKQAKGEMYEWLFENGGLVFVNSDNEHLLGMLHPQRTFTYGTSNLAECSGDLLPSDGFFLKLKAVLHIDDEQTVEMVEFNTKLLGNYNFENVLAAAAIGKYFGVKASAIKEAVENYVPKNNRSQLVKTEKNTLLLDAYNANPSSVKAAIENMAALHAENKALVLGEMLEMGEFAENVHAEVIELLQSTGLSQVFLVGETFMMLNSAFPTFETTDELKEHLRKKPLNNAHILIKGSRGIRLEQIVELL